MATTNGTRDYGNADQIEGEQKLSLVTAPSQDLDSAGTKGKTLYVNPKFNEYNGYYRQNQGGSKAAIKKYSAWIVGRGYRADEKTTKILEKINGNGKDTFDSINENMIRMKKVNGDSFAEIVTNDGETLKDDGTNLLNLKPLNPGRIQTIANESGIIVGYQQLDKKGEPYGNVISTKKIFHLMNDRDGDEIHGVSVYEGSTGILDKIQQLDEDMTIVFHRYVMPLMLFRAKTHKKEERDILKAQLKEWMKKGNGMIIPDKALDGEAFKIPQFASIDPLNWRKEWKSEAIKDLGIPELVLGSADGTVDASAKMVYLAYQQTIDDEQRELEEQMKLQLHIDVDFNFPARIEENLGEDEGKDGDINTTKKSEVQITSIKKEGKNPSNSTTEATL